MAKNGPILIKFFFKRSQECVSNDSEKGFRENRLQIGQFCPVRSLKDRRSMID